MAAELDTNTATGEKAVFSVRESMWHRSGAVLAAAPTLDEALAVAGHHFDVALRPLFAVAHNAPVNADGLPLAIEDLEDVGHRATYRTDRGTILGVVGPKYTPLQNRDAFAVLQPLLDQGLCSLETGGTLREGRDVWMQVKFNIDSDVVREAFADRAGDGGIIPYGLISNNHSGTRQVIVQETPVRVVCANTLRAATAAAVGKKTAATLRAKGIVMVRHTLNVEARTTEAAMGLWDNLVSRYETVARQFLLMRATHLDTAMFRQLVLDQIAPLPTRSAKTTDARFAGMMARAEEKRGILVTHWRNGSGHTGDDSVWEAYNGAVEVLDHDTGTVKVRGSRAQAAFDGSLGTLHQTVLDGLLRYCVDVNPELATAV